MLRITPAALSVFLAAMLLSAVRASAAGIEYPAAGHFDPAEGTIELWITPMVDDLYPPDDGKYRKLFDLFSVVSPDNWSCVSTWARYKAQIGPRVSMSSKKMNKGLSTLLASMKEVRVWKKGERRHFAFVWKGRDMAMYSDGQRISEEHQQGVGLDGSMAGIPFFIGNKDGDDAPVILNAVRISSIAKPAAALADAEPREEIFTLLLDRFDVPKKLEGGRTRPEAMHSLQDGATGGKILGHARFVTQPTAGLALYKESAGGK
ncbi:MAG: hypothetical protein K0R17_2460 [Rariglobus sp.]|jgi:hypothetical protein|nr:hypothetical protein [Rariglobus sp.]